MVSDAFCLEAVKRSASNQIRENTARLGRGVGYRDIIDLRYLRAGLLVGLFFLGHLGRLAVALVNFLLKPCVDLCCYVVRSSLSGVAEFDRLGEGGVFLPEFGEAGVCLPKPTANFRLRNKSLFLMGVKMVHRDAPSW